MPRSKEREGKEEKQQQARVVEIRPIGPDGNRRRLILVVSPTREHSEAINAFTEDVVREGIKRGQLPPDTRPNRVKKWNTGRYGLLIVPSDKKGGLKSATEAAKIIADYANDYAPVLRGDPDSWAKVLKKIPKR